MSLDQFSRFNYRITTILRISNKGKKWKKKKKAPFFPQPWNKTHLALYTFPYIKKNLHNNTVESQLRIMSTWKSVYEILMLYFCGTYTRYGTVRDLFHFSMKSSNRLAFFFSSFDNTLWLTHFYILFQPHHGTWAADLTLSFVSFLP